MQGITPLQGVRHQYIFYNDGWVHRHWGTPFRAGY